MGLDQFAFYTEDGTPTSDRTVFHTWRKHPDLHGWMFEVYRNKGGTGTFNSDDHVQLTVADLEVLREVIESGNLPTTTGFFFGRSCRRGEEGFDDQQEGDLEFVDKAVELIKQGKAVFYESWW
jgi:hypothetical protein